MTKFLLTLSLSHSMSKIKLVVLSLLIYLTPHLILTADFDETQDKYVVTLERAVVNWYDKNVFDKYEIKTFKYNRTVASYNLTIIYKIDVPTYKIRIRCFKFSGNDYKLTAIQFEINACTMIKFGRMGFKNVVTNSNITNCPMKKGTYVLYNAYMDSSSFPPHFPEGNWKIHLEIIIGGARCVDMNVYANILYPLKRGRH